MAQAKHSPGPWNVINTPNLPIVDRSFRTIALPYPYHDEEMRVADANLIAAAPDLLAALKDIVDCVAKTESMGEICQCDDFTEARAAIAKAEGGAG